MSESQPESPGKHAAPDDDPQSDPPPVAGEGGDHAADGPPEDGDEDPATAEDSSDGSEDSGGTRQPGADPEDAEEIEKERKERLDPDNRPDNVEVDNTKRDFDVEKGMFEDSEGYEEAEEKFPPLGGQGA
jgi:hypothetical protein